MSDKPRFSRVDRVQKQVMREFADILKTEIKDPLLEDYVISVVEVTMPSDLSTAQLYVSIFITGERAEERRTEVMTRLLEYQPKIRKALGQRIRLRHTPDVSLHLVDALERGARVTSLLEKISRGEIQ